MTPSSGLMDRRRFQSTHRVSYAECTAGNHVYHSRFLDILERARGEFFRHLGFPFLELQEQDLIFPVTACELKFRRMARYDDILTIELWLTAMSRARFSCASRILDSNGNGVHEAVVHLACTSVHGRPKRIPEPLAQVLGEYVGSS